MERAEIKKKGFGRRKIEIKKIENKSNLQVTFSKRRKGLIKKAGELSILCGADVAVIVQSPAGKIHAFGNIPVESIMDRYLNIDSPNLSNFPNYNHYYNNENQKKYLEILKKLEAEKDIEKSLEESTSNGDYNYYYPANVASSSRGRGFLQWWDQPFDDLDLVELEEYLNAMEALKNNVMNRANEKAAAAKANNNMNLWIPNLAVDCYFHGAPVGQVGDDFISSGSTSTINTTPLMLFNTTPST